MTKLAAVMAATLCVGAAASQAADAPCDDECKAAKGYPVATHREPPRYPEGAAARHGEGCVVVSFEILPTGQADKYQVLDSRPPGVFDGAALKALNKWKFKVPEKPGRYSQRIDFRMGDQPTERPWKGKEKSEPLPCMPAPSYEQLNTKKAQ